jgi:hypothetical protein
MTFIFGPTPYPSALALALTKTRGPTALQRFFDEH